jgi:hypothetical protein
MTSIVIWTGKTLLSKKSIEELRLNDEYKDCQSSGDVSYLIIGLHPNPGFPDHIWAYRVLQFCRYHLVHIVIDGDSGFAHSRWDIGNCCKNQAGQSIQPTLTASIASQRGSFIGSVDPS